MGGYAVSTRNDPDGLFNHPAPLSIAADSSNHFGRLSSRSTFGHQFPTVLTYWATGDAEVPRTGTSLGHTSSLKLVRAESLALVGPVSLGDSFDTTRLRRTRSSGSDRHGYLPVTPRLCGLTTLRQRIQTHLVGGQSSGSEGNFARTHGPGYPAGA